MFAEIIDLNVIRKAISNLGYWGLKRLYANNVITTIEGIPIVSLRDDQTNFRRIISLSFDLLRSHDSRRLRRIVSAADWIVDCSLPLGGRSGLYCRRLAAIEMDFEFSDNFGDDLMHAAYFAALLVYEGTHGMLMRRGFEYTNELRLQSERICVAEQNRFLARLEVLRTGLGDTLLTEFNASNWEEAWAMDKWERVRRLAARAIRSG